MYSNQERKSARLQLFPFERQMILNALSAYRLSMSKWNQKQLDIVINRVKSNEVNLDGGEFESIKRALNHLGMRFFQQGKRSKAEPYFAMAAWIKEQKVIFQEENGPKVKATSAGTLIALR